MTTRRAWTLMTVGGCLVVAGPLLLGLALASSGWWWSGPEVSVPRDGEAHVVRLDGPGTRVLWSDRTLVEPTCRARDRAGRDVAVETLPEERRVLVGTTETAPLAVAEVRLPDDGTLVLTCDAVRAEPAVGVGLGPALSAGERSRNAVLSATEAWAPLALPVGGAVLVVAGALGLGRDGRTGGRPRRRPGR